MSCHVGPYLQALHNSSIQGLALGPLKAVALQPGVLQGLLGGGPGIMLPARKAAEIHASLENAWRCIAGAWIDIQAPHQTQTHIAMCWMFIPRVQHALPCVECALP